MMKKLRIINCYVCGWAMEYVGDGEVCFEDDCIETWYWTSKRGEGSVYYEDEAWA